MIATATITLDNGDECEVSAEVYSQSEHESATPTDDRIQLNRFEQLRADEAIQEAALDAAVERAELLRDIRENPNAGIVLTACAKCEIVKSPSESGTSTA